MRHREEDAVPKREANGGTVGKDTCGRSSRWAGVDDFGTEITGTTQFESPPGSGPPATLDERGLFTGRDPPSLRSRRPAATGSGAWCPPGAGDRA
mmetsp:Transcript_5734/g.23820  ORF Transcript_5734/g.23820 Transcript_5734/m.23820 type:complete len:95 (+) Transcript_5734:1726-2010(+)